MKDIDYREILRQTKVDLSNQGMFGCDYENLANAIKNSACCCQTLILNLKHKLGRSHECPNDGKNWITFPYNSELASAVADNFTLTEIVFYQDSSFGERQREIMAPFLERNRMLARFSGDLGGRIQTCIKDFSFRMFADYQETAAYVKLRESYKIYEAIKDFKLGLCKLTVGVLNILQQDASKIDDIEELCKAVKVDELSDVVLDCDNFLASLTPPPPSCIRCS